MSLPIRLILTLFIVLQFITLPATASAASQKDIHALEQTIEQKQQRLTNFQSELIELEQEHRSLQRNMSSINIDLKLLKRQALKLEAMSTASSIEEDEKQLSIITYKRRVAEIAQEKNHSRAEKISKQQNQLQQNIKRLENLLLSLNKDLSALNEKYASSNKAEAEAARRAKEKRLAAKRLQQESQKLRQQKALALDKQERLAQKKPLQVEKEQQLIVKKQPLVDRQEQKRLQNEAEILLKKTAGLPQDQAALVRAQYIAKNNPTEAPSLGHAPLLKVANPTGSKPKSLVQMRHLGNHQYSATIEVEKGRQQYIVGKHKFDKSIPKQFNGLTCLIIIDARTEKPTFQLIAKSNR